MKEKIKQLWLTALRSGKYKQGKSQLKDAQGNFCCLGVLCDLHRKATKKKGWRVFKRTNFYGCEYTGLPNKVLDWSGITERSPYSFTAEKSLADLNDNGKTFLEIADIIEKEF